MNLALKDLLKKILNTQDNWKIKILTHFPDIVGKDLCDHMSIIKINDCGIIIGVNNSCLLQELHSLTPLLLNKINKTLDIPRITNIQFKLRGQSHMHISNKILQDTVIIPTEDIILSQHDLLPLTKIKDKELVHVLETFRKRCYKESQWRKK